MSKNKSEEVTFDYVPDEEPKRTHHWDKNEAGFVEVNGELVAKCPSKISLQAAKDLLNNGIA